MDIKFFDRAEWDDINTLGNNHRLYDNLEVDLSVDDYDIDNSDDSSNCSSVDNNSNSTNDDDSH